MDNYTYDPTAAADAAFRSLTLDTGVVAKPGGASFAISGAKGFRWLSYGSAVARNCWGSDPQRVHNAALSEYRQLRSSKEDIAVYFPSREAANMAGITPAELVAGVAHESGHYLLDFAGDTSLADEEFERFVEPLKKLHAIKGLSGLHRAANLMADIRLERRMGAMFPHLVPRFEALQRWINRHEAQARSKADLASHLMMAMRDIGKGWITLAEAESLYMPEAIAFVKAHRHIWEKLTDTSRTADETGADPLIAAFEWLLAIGATPEPPEPPKPPKRPKPPQPPEGDCRQPPEGGDEDGDEDGDGGDGGDEDGGDGGGGDGGDEDGGDEDGGDGDAKELAPQGTLPSGDVDKILRGDYTAHDPGSLSEKLHREARDGATSMVWVDGGDPAKIVTKHNLW